MKKALLLMLLIVNCYTALRAQDMLGTWGSNYGGVNAAIQNPTLIANSRLYADVNLVGATFGYYHNDSYIENPVSYAYDYLHQQSIGFPPQAAKTNYYNNHRPDIINGFISARELGPAFMLNNGMNAYAFSYSIREAFSATKIPDVVGQITEQGFADPSVIAHGTYDISSPMRLAGLAWGEAAFTYARVLKSYTRDVMTLGITLKYLTGFGGGFIYSNNDAFAMTDRNQITINKSTVKAGLSIPFRYDDPKQQVSYDPNYSWGTGFGTDLGFSIQHNLELHYNTKRFSRLCEQEFEPYDYRFSVAIVDLGYIRFKDNAISGTLSNSKPISYDFRNFVYTNTNNAIDTLNTLYNPKDSSIVKKKFSIVTPTALTFQYDKRITPNIYITTAAVIGIPISKNAVQRPSQFAVIPRYESDIFEVSLPVSLYEFTKPRVGLSGRIFFLTLGTDRLLSLSGVHDYYGYDFYASIRLNFMKIFRMNYIKGQCRESLTHPCF
ncbi:MAG: DUF5723 family protein [Bacteroidota bacterium]|nr:DUF5723 family protein [Bacteroidota bacterium]